MRINSRFLLSLFFLSAIAIGIFLVVQYPAFANPIQSKALIPDLKFQVPIGELAEITSKELKEGCGIQKFLVTAYQWILGFIMLLSVLVLVFAGFVWMTAHGSSEQIKKAHGIIRNTLIGLGLAIGSYVILNAISPDLLKLSCVNLKKMEPLDLKIVNIPEEEQEDFEEKEKQSGPPKPAGPNGTTGGSPVARDGRTPMTLSQSRMIRNVKLASSVVDSFDAAVREVRQKYPEFQFVTVGGQGHRDNPKSCHNNGLSVDINYDQNPCGPYCHGNPNVNCCWGKPGVKVGSGEFRPYRDNRSFTKEIIQIFQKHGWCWGGNWTTFKDFHHLSRCAKDCSDRSPYQFPSH